MPKELDPIEEILATIKTELDDIKSRTVGWSRVDYPYGYLSREHAIDIETWVEENRTDEYVKWGRTFYFKNEQDASHFLLRWN